MGLVEVAKSFFGRQVDVTGGVARNNVLGQQTEKDIMYEDALRLVEYANNQRAYWGLFPDPLLHEEGDTSDTVRVNKIKPIVNITAHFLFGTPPNWEIPKEESVGGAKIEGDNEDSPVDSEAEKWLKEFHVVNNYPAFLLDEAINGAISGTPYYKIIPVEAGQDFPRLQVLDPASMTIKWHPRDISHVTCYKYQYNTVNDEGVPIVVRQLTEEMQDEETGVISWRITDQYAVRSPYQTVPPDGGWVTEAVTPWDYPWPPIAHCKNLPSPNEVYGEPDVSATIIESNKAVNFAFSNWNRINKHHAHPRVWLKGNRGLPAELIKLGPNAIWDIPDPQAEVGQLVPAIDGTASLQLIDELTEEILVESATPSTAIGMLETNQRLATSGVALRVKMWPMIMKTEVKRKLYGPWIIELNRRALALGGFGDDIRIELTWPEMLPIDPLNERQVAQIDQLLGVSEATLLKSLGFNYETEKVQKQAEADDALEQAKKSMAAGVMPMGGGPAGAAGSGGGGGKPFMQRQTGGPGTGGAADGKTE